MKPTLFILLLLGASGLLAQKQENAKDAKFPEAGTYKNTKMSYKIIAAPNNTFAYDIYSNSKLIIHQPSVPGVAGNEGFKTRAGAEKTAQLVIGKIDKGEMPPNISTDEMKKLKALP